MSLTATSDNQTKARLNHVLNYRILKRKHKRAFYGFVIPCFILLIFCSPVGVIPNKAESTIGGVAGDALTNLFGPAEGQQAYSATGASQPVAFDGLLSNDTQPLVMLNPSAPTAIPIQAPSGWTGYDLSGTLDHLSTEFRPLKNGLLDEYHEERHILSGSPWNSEVFNVPDDWSILKNGDSTSHPTHGGLYWYTAAGSGRDGSMGWRPSVLFSAGNPLNPNMELYLSQGLQLPWRDVYSCKVRVYHTVPGAQVMNDIFYLFVDVGGYRAKFNVFSSGYVTDEWIQGVAEIPGSVFANMPIPGTTALAIGLGTDFSGNSPSNINNRVFIDQIEVIFEARPLPEQIGLSANQSIITSATPGSVSTYVPDSAARDCFSRSDTGISTSSALEVGVWSSSGTTWNDVVKYQIGIQFPLDIPQGAIITYAALEVEALGYFGGGDNSLRVLVAEEDNVSPFTNGLPTLENRYSWSQTSVAWIQDTWENGYRYLTPDMSTLVQGVVSRTGWSGGNYICLMIDYMNSNQYRDWNSIMGTWSYNGDNLPRLYVDYVVPQEEDTISVLQYRKDLTIDHTKVSSDLEDFPVLVDIYDSDLKTDAQQDGDDIRFVLGSEKLDYQIELFDPDFNGTHAHLIAWVQVSYLSASEDTVISMQYGAPEAQNIENSESVWQGYESVWHLTEQSGNGAFLTDSSHNGHGGIPTLTSYMQNGMIDGARYIQNVEGNYISFVEGEGIFDGWADWQFSFWIYFDFDTDAEFWSNEWRVFDKGIAMNLARTFNVGVPGYANFQVDTHFNGYDAYFGVLVKRKAWNYVVMKFESSGDGTLRGYSYADGVLVDSNSDSSPGTGTTLRSDPNMFVICTEGGGTPFRGGIDEFRVMNGFRSAGWIQTEYANQYNPSGFLTQGIEQTVQFGETLDLVFSTTAESVVEILPRLILNVTYSSSTLDANFQHGTSFSVSNGTAAAWTANVLVSPPLGVSELSFNLTNPAAWTLTGVTDSVGQNRLSEVTTTSTQVMVTSSILDVDGIWTFTFSSSNEASLLECGANAGAYGNSVALQIGDLAKFRGTATVTPGSAMRLHLVDPSGQLYYSTDDLSQDGSGQFEWIGISVTGAWPNGLWEAHVDFNNTADSSPERVGRYSRLFTVKHASSLNLLSPADAVGDGVSVRTAGELLEVEVQLTNTETAQNVTGSTVMMNWSVSGIETQVQFEDYGNGVYGKALNTSDLGQPGNWRLNIVSSHPYLINATTFFDLELSHNTILTYRTPSSTPYTDDFSVRLNLQDAITGTNYDGASFTSNGTISGVTDYNNGTYLVSIDSTGLSLGTYCYTINAIPAQSFVIESSLDVVFRYREIETDLVQIETNPVSVPWEQNATVTLNWLDIDHANVGISGGVLSGDGTFQYVDLLDGRYSIQIDVESYSVGIYLFNFTITRTNYQLNEITVAVTVRTHRTLVMASYDGSIPLGSNVSVTLTFLDQDEGNAPITGNLSSVLVEWIGGSAVYGSLQILIETQDWIISDYTIDITVLSSTSPRYYYDGSTALLVRIQKLTAALSWDDIGVLPIGDDFEITTHVTVNDSSSIYDNMSVNGLLQSHFVIRDKDGSVYTIKTFSAQASGTYILTLDQSYFPGGSYGIRVFLVFGVAENYSNTQTPIIGFQFTQARSDLSSPDYPLLTISYSTNAVVTLEFVDIDRGQGIDTATISVTGAVKLGQQLISNGRYRVTIDTSTWSIGIYTVNFTASALNYDNKTISIDIQIRQIRTYAIATVGVLEIPVGDSRTFYADYIDMDHNLQIFTSSHLCNWTPAHYDIVWTGSRYSIKINTYNTDTLTSYLLVFDFSAGAEYEAASFNVTLVIRSIKTELRLLSPIEDSTPSGQIEISIYYGDRDHLQGIVSSDVLCTIWNTTHQLVITWNNDTSAGYYIITIDASQFGSLGIKQLTIFFNWTGSIQKYENRNLSTTVDIIGEDTELTLIEAALPSPCLDYMTYTFLYSSATMGTGISNDTFNVFINVEFVGVTVDLSQVNIWEIDSSGRPGEYAISFNNTILGRTGIFSMKMFINWSAGVSPFYTNRTDLISVRVLPRSASFSVIPPTNVPFGENATFSFTYEDTTGGTSSPIAYDPVAMIVSLDVPEFTLTYNALESLYTVSFNTSQLGAPLGVRTLILNLTWSGLPFYSNVTGRLIEVTLTERQTILTYPTPPATPYGNNATFTVTYVDIGGSTSKPVLETIIEIYVGITMIPSSYVQITHQGFGEYQIDLNTSYFSQPGLYSLRIEASSGEFYYQARSATKSLEVDLRATLLTAEPVGSIPYGESFDIVLYYQDLDTLLPIGNDTGFMISLEILNGTDWLFTCSWRPSLQNYLLTVETSNQALELGLTYHLWLNFSAEYEVPFYQWNDISVPFEMRERDTSLDLISSPSQTHYQDYANFTILFKDILSSSGISGSTISLYHEFVLLVPSVDYEINEVSPGQYEISVDTSVLGQPGSKTIQVIADWTVGSPHYRDAQRNISIPVTERPTSVEIVFPPGQTWYLENITLDFAFVDISTGARVVVPLSDIKIYSEATLLAYGEYVIQQIGSIFRLQVNSTIISASLESNWNLTIQIDWTAGAPYYEDEATSVFVTTIGRVGNIELSQIEETPFGDIMNISLIYTDQRTGEGIEGATIVFDCTEVPGLVEGVDYWVQIGTGVDSGKYRVLISTSSLGSLGVFTFDIEVQWSVLVSPFYTNINAPEVQGLVREIQTSVSSDLPSPSVVAFYEDVSFVILFTDTDHGVPINGAEGQISIRYQSTGLEPSSWLVQTLGGGQYNITLSMIDSLGVGLQSIIVTINLSPYQMAQTSVVFGLRNRVAGLSAVVSPTNYAGYATSVMIYLVDYDANDNPLAGAALSLTWGDSSSYIDLGDGSYNLSLQTSNLEFGSQILTVQANLLHYAITSLNVEINLLAVPSELIVSWSGPRLTNEIYWGEPLTIFAAINDTLRNQTVSVSTITYDWDWGTGSFLPSGEPGKYAAILDTSLGSISDTIIVRIVGSAPNYIDASYQLVFRLLPRPMEVNPIGGYVFTVSYGDTAQVVVKLEDTLDGSLVTEVNLAARWDYDTNLTLVEISGSPGYYRLLISTGTAGFGSYQIHLDASKQNYGDTSATLIMVISKIQMVVWLDNVTAAYEYTSVYWSEVVRIGVYVLAPALNASYPFSTGLDGLFVSWNSPELGTNGTLVNGILIGGAGYYYYDFNTSQGIAALHTFVISANPFDEDYERADNSTSIFVRNLEATIVSPGTDEFVWGWTGLVNVTYYDNFHARGVQADTSVFSWAGGSGSAFYLSEGVYGIPINTTKLRPGTYTIIIEFRKANYDDVEITIRIHIATVPTEIAIRLPELYRIGDTWTNLQVPYGDILSVTLLYNDTNNARGIPDAIFNSSFYTGPGVYEGPLFLTNHGNGNYSFVFSTLDWSLHSSVSFHIRFMRENYTAAVFVFEITIIKIETNLEVIGPSVISLNWGMNTTFWVFYSDAWPGHAGEGITDAIILIGNPRPNYVTIEYLGPDVSHPGYYQFRATAHRIAGAAAEVTINFNKTYYVESEVTLSISASPSAEDIALQNVITYGGAFVIFLILFAVVWVRILRVPKIIRVISGQIRQLRRGRMPKPAKGAPTRQSLVAELFNELHEEIGVKRKPTMMPEVSIIIEVPEIDELIIDLAILTGMTQQELDDFKFEISKMKMSQQTSFVREVIGQEVIRVAGVQNKSVEQVVEEVVAERRKRIGGAATVTRPEIYDTIEEEADVSEPAEEGIDFEHRLRELELEEMAAELDKRGIPSHEIESFISQARELPKDVVELLLQSFTPREKPEPVEEKIEHLSEKELEDLRSELIKRKASDREIESIIEQARTLPKELALEFFKEPEEPKKRKRRKKVDTLSEEERADLQTELVRKKVPEIEIEAIMKEAETAPRKKIEEFLKSIEDTEFEVPIQEMEFEDRLSDFELEDLRKQLEKRGLPPEEIGSIVKQAKNLPSALIDDLLKSIDVDLEERKKRKR
ncbi:MAG: hypothetical protein ThorAB25_04900 [Candidatus Thorarchaeota archaeon AB_25]|nr:MAG: hypothetical protein ThorAB25_04900 [Candidatus Thorarchaeota archaeon AB_25]